MMNEKTFQVIATWTEENTIFLLGDDGKEAKIEVGDPKKAKEIQDFLSSSGEIKVTVRERE